MIDFLVNRPIAILITFFGLMLLGVAASFKLPTSLIPDTDIPEITVHLSGDSYAAEEMEQLLTSPVRNSLQSLHGLEHIESTSEDGSANIRLEFQSGSNMTLAFIAVNEKIDAAMNQFPRDVERPVATKSGISDMPVFSINVYDKNGNSSALRHAEISNFCKEIIRRRIEQLGTVSMVDISGISQPQIQLRPRKEYLRALGIDNNLFSNALLDNSSGIGNILVKDGNYTYYLKLNTEHSSIADIKNIPIRVNKRIFRLKDLAEIELTNASPTGSYLSDTHRAVNLRIIKQASVRMDDLKKSVGELLLHLRNDYPDLVFCISEDQTSMLDYSLSNLKQDLLIGGSLAFVCMLLFIRKIRPALLIGITIPIALLISQLGFYLVGLSINVFSLGGLILGLGMIIDNSIVVIDTISNHRMNGETEDTAAVRGTSEIIRPLFASILTNCAVFLPLIFMSGLAGAIFYEQAISVIIGLISSLLVSILLLPPLYVLIYRIKLPQYSPRMIHMPQLIDITRLYEKGLYWVFNHRKTTFLLVAIFFLLGCWTFTLLKKDRLPPLRRSDFELLISWNEPIDLQKGMDRVNELLQKQRPHIIETNTWVGEQQYVLSDEDALDYTQTRIHIKATDARQVENLERNLGTICSNLYPLAMIKFSLGRNPLDVVFSNHLPPLRILLFAAKKRSMPDRETVQKIQDNLQKALPGTFINPISVQEKIVLTINAVQAAVYDINQADIMSTIAKALKPEFIDEFHGPDALIPIVIKRDYVQSVHDLLENTFVAGRNGQQIPISILINLNKDRDFTSINAGAEGDYYPIDIDSKQPAKDLEIIKSVLAKYSGLVTTDYKGSYFDNQKLVLEMTVVLLASIILLYFILAAQFESLFQPLLILAELPIAITGGIILLYLGGNSLNLMSMIGIVIMSGLVINDSILKIDAINNLRKGGIPIMEAIIEGGHKRLKPIIMISLTNIGALLPTLFMNDLGSELQKPLSLALFGGLTFGLFISLFFVPLLYWLFYRTADGSNN
jgi:multidrug efflux pump subunit AcrB